jgi:peptidyl-prolyl cis-trans isomerase C
MFFGAVRLATPLLISALPLVAAQGQVAPPQASPPAAAAPAADPVVAKVNGDSIHLSEVKAASETLPPNLRSMPFEVIYPKLLDSMITERVLADAARKAGLDKDPAVQRQIAATTNQVLDNALLTKVVMPSVTDQALHARYQKEIAGKPGVEEVHAKHILVESEDQAKQIITELNNGGDFAALAKKYSKDPGSASADGGDLGFFKKDEMVAPFAEAAFALKPGQFTQTPVHSQFGWHVILLVERRQSAPPTFEQAQDELRQEMLKDGVQQEITKARADATVQTFNMDGSPMRPTDTAVPPSTTTR